MTYAISVPTPFNDISELAESFYSRVDEERIMLPNPDAIPEGEWVQFHVTLADGSAALQGQGRCTGSYDNGEERAPEHRFDVVMDSLQLDEMGQIYFERILQVRAAYAGDEPQTGEVAVPEEVAEYTSADFAAEPEEEVAAEEDYADAAAFAAEPAGDAEAGWGEPEAYEEAPVYAEAPLHEDTPGYEETPAYEAVPAAEAVSFEAPEEELPAAEALVEEAPEIADWEEPSGATEIGSIEEYVDAPVLATPGQSRIYELPPPAAPDALPSPHSVPEVLTRPVLHASWSPEPLPRMDPGPSSGYFQYAVGAGLPQPAEPPRPEMDPSLRVVRAPVASDPHAGAIFAEGADEHAAAAPAYDAQAYAEPPAGEAAYAAEYEEEDAYDDSTAYDAEEEGEEAGWDEGEYEEEEGYGAEYGDESTLDAEGYVAGGHEETRQVDLGGLPPEVEIGEETMQVESPED